MYFFIWSLILGDIVDFPTLSKSFDSMDATDQPPPTRPPTPPGAYPGRSPNRGGNVLTDRSDGILDGGSRSDDEILDGGRGGKPALSVLS
mmetsp:Transcript_26878/g.50906  ORF Transcript_26878/g.50906 Transcript_26878/m.50906 type:complete len:90 (-) Transcript_26878:1514-1783(-)